ncbi:vacuolar protein sorting-associated protein 13A-like [Anneissia japonica]|uniref:vacuolar protein sorting-associated protein 13A-like n=1 Tax=Anneissia japonica TaxID=1529436 RepID=UPI001425AD1E|nr:vacuolar protein sorting-associated protein 13A-like [Anneissia japonica]
MVFESLVVDLLNRFLGPYVENLNKNSLKLGIWSGDAVLENLRIKDGALDELELPFQVKAGSLEKLTLKIPWKNLYTSQVVAKIDGLYLLVVPKQGSYDAEKSKKNQHEAKQKALEKVEQAKEQEKTQESDNKSDTFAEKLATQIIKNLQVEIQNIHIRYEDNVTNSQAPFSAGVSLHNLSFETTNADWQPCILEQAVKMVYKLVKLDCLALYLNSNTRLFSSMSKEQCLMSLKSTIASPGHMDPDFQYVVEPISSEAQLKINPKPGNDLSTPKAWLNLVIKSIDLTLRQQQYQNLIQLLDSFERMVRNEPYMKYRPKAVCRGHAKLWWKYAQTSILEENVRRRHRMWSWKHIKKHRDQCRGYKEAYGKKLATSKPSKELLSQLESFEDELDVFNLTLCRQQAELQYKRKKKKKEKEKKNSGWFGGFFGGKKEKEKDDSLELNEVAERMQNAMTADDKAKLYEAIGYTEEIPDTVFPKEYIGILLNFHLIQTSVNLVDDTVADKCNVLGVQISDLKAGISQRPSADAIRVEAKLNTFSVFGTPVGSEQPQMVESQNLEADKKVDLLEVEFETNPLDGSVDQRVKVLTRPLKIVYDSNTINQIVKFFEPPQDVHLEELSAAAASTIDEFTEQSATSLQYMADTKTILDVTVDLKPSYIIIPENGVYSKNGKVLVADLGHFRMTTEHEVKVDAPRKENESLEELMKKSYDRFNMDLKSVQIILANQGDDWQAARKQIQSPLHLLQPLNLQIALHKCLVEDNRMPKVRISGELPSLDVDISDKKLKDLISLATSIPLPETKSPDQKQAAAASKASFSSSAIIPLQLLSETGVNLNVNLDSDDDDSDDDDSDVTSDGYFTPCEDPITDKHDGVHITDKHDGVVEKLTTTRDVVMFDTKKFAINAPSVATEGEDEDEFLSADEGDFETTKPKLKREQSLGSQPRSNLELDFEVKRIILNICQNNGTVDVPLLAINVIGLGAKVDLKPWQVTLDASLGSVSVQHMQMEALDGGDLYLVKTPLQADTGERLMHLNYQKIEKDNPDFHTVHNSTEQNIQIEVAGLSLIAHAQAILNLVTFSEQIVAMLDTNQDEDKALDEGYSSDSDKKPVRKRQTRPLPSKVIDIQLMAKLDVISIEACTCDAALAHIDVKGVEAGVTVQKHQTIVSASLKDVAVIDPSPNTIYPKILSIVESSEVFKLGLVVHNSATVGQHYTDMSAVDISLALSVGCLQAVFVNKFIMDLLQFVDHFSTAKKVVIEAGADAATSAAKTMQEMQAEAMRALLDVNIKAPVVIIPRSSNSKMAIYADLGQLCVKNSFKIAAGSEDLDVPAVIDTMSIDLRNVKLSRAFIDNGEVQAESLMLEPANMELEIQRNLAASYFTKLPAITISGKLQAINMHVGPGDIGLAFGVLNENLTEGKARPDDITESEDVNTKDEKSLKKGAKDGEGADEKNVSSQLSLSFTIESVGITLYQKSPDLTTGSGVQIAKEGLGRLTVHGLEVEADMLTDGSLSAHMHLIDSILDDIRPERIEGVTRMFGRKADTDEERQMLVVKVDQRSNGSILIVVNFNDVQTCVCVEFLMTMSQIFLKGLEDGESADVKKRRAENVQDSSQSASPSSLDLSFHLKVENPEIVLVADSSRKDTNCLVMRSIGDMRLRMNSDVMSVNGGFSQVSINACPYLVENRKGKIRKVLIPCNIGFQLQAPTGGAQHINVSCQEVFVNISPATVAILAAAAQGLTPPPVEEEQNDEAPKDLWGITKVKDQNFWFLRDDTADVDVDELSLKTMSDTLLPETSRGEELIFTVETFGMKVEMLCGSKMLPMLSAEAKVEAIIKDWSTRMKMESTITLEMSSYNEKTACWDPLLEPLEMQSGGHRPWHLNISMLKNDDISDASSSTGTSTTSSEDESIEFAPPLMSITVSSHDVMQLTVTKSCLTMLMKLSEIFSEALSKGHSEIQPKTKAAACTITNSIGVSIYLTPGKYFEIPDYAKDGRIRLQPGEVVDLDMSRELSRKAPLRLQSFMRSSTESAEQSINFQVEGFDEVRNVVLSRVGHILYNLKPTTKHKADMLLSVALEIEAQMDSRFIVIRSPLQMFNHFSIPIEVFIRENNAMRNIGVIEPEKRFPVPLYVAHTQDLYVKPKGEYKMCSTPLKWKDLLAQKKQGRKYVSFSCDWNEPGYTPFCFNAITEMDKLRYVKGSSIQSPKYIIHLHPAVMLRNLLPFPVYYTLAGTDGNICIEKANQSSLLHVVMGKTMMHMRIENYMGMDWNGEITLRETLKTPLFQWGFRGSRQGHDNVWLEVGVWADYSSGYLDMAIYSPYWLVNKTEQTLRYRLPLLMKGSQDEIIEHAADTKEPILFSYPSKKSTPGKNKTTITMQICDSDWSDKFSLDTVGSSGFITCSGKGQNYNIGVKNQFSNFGLTKIIVFTPEYLLVNHSEHDVICKELSGPDLLQYDVASGQCIPFWPVDHSNHRKLVVKLKGHKHFSEPFLFTDPHTTVLKMDQEVGGITAETQLTETARVVAIHGFKQGNFTVKLVNTTEYEVQYNQQGVADVSPLGPGECILYTWQVPTRDRQLVLKIADKTIKNDLVKDGIGEIIRPKERIYWVSFLDGRQRILLFTKDLVIATKAQQAGELEQVNMELNLSLEGVGLSMVNNYTRTEVAYVGLTSSGIIWQAKQRRRFRDMPGGQVALLETEYQKYELEQQQDKNAPPAVYKAGNMEIDFENLVMYNPKRHHIKRTHHPGVWAQVKVSPHQLQFHLKTHRIQMDNQTKTPIFPTVLAPVAPPKSVATENALKPMIEVSLLMGYAEHSNVQQIKLFQVLIQEMHVKLDQGFLSNFINYLQPETEIEGKEYLKVLMRLTLFNMPKIFLRLGYFERRFKFYSQPQLTLELTKHYSNQAVKQLYVLVLGLDVIGNPFGFVQGMGAGIKDLFYEPYQGAVQGPEEFAEGVALGMRSLFGHAVGGAAGAVSRITGTLGKGLAALTMDDDYKRKRQQAINRQPKTLQEGFARGGKGLVMGFVEGVSGVVTKPVQGVKKEGAKGFFKGMGKGLAGIVAKPTGGVIDFASSTFEGIRRATEVSTEVKKLRPARFLHPDHVVRPYVLYEATGNCLLQEIDKGKFALTDDYVDHLQVMKDCIMLLTDRRIIYIVKQDVLGGWNVAWHHTWKELKEPPVLMEKGIQVIPKEQEQPVKRGPLGRPLKIANLMKGKGPQGKIVLINNRDVGRRFASKMQETYAKALKIIQ